jgi:hypothetical protein
MNPAVKEMVFSRSYKDHNYLISKIKSKTNVKLFFLTSQISLGLLEQFQTNIQYAIFDNNPQNTSIPACRDYHR